MGESGDTMKIKEYEVRLHGKFTNPHTFIVEAPNKRIAKWCGANLFNHQYFSFATAKDIMVIPYTRKEEA